MSKTQKHNMERLQGVLDGYGANVSSWPEDDHGLLEFIAQDLGAGQLFREARALDQLLDLAAANEATEPKENAVLQSRILGDFVSVLDNKQVVVPFAGPKNAGVAASFFDAGWFMPATLAACFAFGLYLGGIGVGDWTLDPANSLAAWSNNGGQLTDMAELVVSSSFEEDLL